MIFAPFAGENPGHFFAMGEWYHYEQNLPSHLDVKIMQCEIWQDRLLAMGDKIKSDQSENPGLFFAMGEWYHYEQNLPSHLDVKIMQCEIWQDRLLAMGDKKKSDQLRTIITTVIFSENVHFTTLCPFFLQFVFMKG